MRIGFDFGTSNSLIAVAPDDGQAPQLVQLDQDAAALPSTIFYPEASGGVPLYGAAALSAAIEDGEAGRLFRAFKRLLGSDIYDGDTRLSDGKRLAFHDLLVGFLTQCRLRVEGAVQQSITHAVIGRPVTYGSDADTQKALKRMQTACHDASFKNVSFIYEPLAAALYHEESLDEEKLALVVDIGGGTSDFTVLRLGSKAKASQDRQNDVLGIGGCAIGGTDFDRILSVAGVMPHFGLGQAYQSASGKMMVTPKHIFHSASDWNHILTQFYQRATGRILADISAAAYIARLQELYEERAAHRLLGKVEAVKVLLSSNGQAILDAGFVEMGLEIVLLREVYEAALHEACASLLSAAMDAVTAAQLSAADIDMVITTGGASQTPLIEAAFAKAFPKAERSQHGRFDSVARGLCRAGI